MNEEIRNLLHSIKDMKNEINNLYHEALELRAEFDTDSEEYELITAAMDLIDDAENDLASAEDELYV